MQTYTVTFNESEFQANGGTFYHSGVTLDFNDWLDETTAQYTAQVEDWAMRSFEQYLNTRGDVISWERGPIDKHSPRYQFMRSYPDGEVYAVRYHDDGHGTITGACGPLAFRDVRLSELPNYEYENAELISWFMGEEHEGEPEPTFVPLSEEEVAAIEQQAEDMTDINEIARRIEREFRADYDTICAALTAVNERGDAIEYHGTVAAGLMQEHGTHVAGLTVPPLDAEVRARLLAQARELGGALYAMKRQMQREMDALWPIR